MAVIWQEVPNAESIKQQNRFPTTDKLCAEKFEQKEPKSTSEESPEAAIPDSHITIKETPKNTNPVN